MSEIKFSAAAKERISALLLETITYTEAVIKHLEETQRELGANFSSMVKNGIEERANYERRKLEARLADMIRENYNRLEILEQTFMQMDANMANYLGGNGYFPTSDFQAEKVTETLDTGANIRNVERIDQQSGTIYTRRQ